MEDNMAMALREAYLMVHRQTNLYLSKYEITADQFVCLAILDANKGITQQELTKRANSDPNTIRAMLVLLENRGLVLRECHPQDGRAWSVFLTKKGYTIFKKLVEELVPIKNKMLNIFSETELNKFLGYLSRLSFELKNG